MRAAMRTDRLFVAHSVSLAGNDDVTSALKRGTSPLAYLTRCTHNVSINLPFLNMFKRFDVILALLIVASAGAEANSPAVVKAQGLGPAIQESQGPDSIGHNGNFNNEAYLALAAGKYAVLERKYVSLLNSYIGGKISEEDLFLKFDVFGSSMGLEMRFDEWVMAYPDSYAAKLARGLHLLSVAWEKRGTKFADETTDEQFKGFVKELSQAAADLEASVKLNSKPIGSYTALIKVSRGLGWGPDSDRHLLDEALRVDSQAYLPRLTYLYSLTPRWGGSAILMEEFLKECRGSSLSEKNKERIEASYFLHLGQEARRTKDYEQASTQFFEAYRHDGDPKSLFLSGQSALDGSVYDLAFQRFDALVKAHSEYPYGYNKRGWMYESYFKDDKKAFDDYLSAAELGNSYAQNRVGWWYMTGRYVAKDFIRAKVYFKRAADQKNENAIANLKNLDMLRKANAGAQ